MNDLGSLTKNKIDKNNTSSLIDSLKSEASFKDALINEENVFAYLEVFNSIKHCKGCMGLDNCKNNVKGFIKYYDLKTNTVKAESCKYKALIEKKNLILVYLRLCLCLIMYFHTL